MVDLLRQVGKRRGVAARNALRGVPGEREELRGEGVLLDEGVPIDGSMRDYGSHFDVALRAFRYKLEPRRSDVRASGADVDDPVGVQALVLEYMGGGDLINFIKALGEAGGTEREG